MVNNGSVPLARVNDMVTRTIAAWYKMGQDENYPDVSFSQLTQATFLNGEMVNSHIKCVYFSPKREKPLLMLRPARDSVQADHFKLIRQIGAASTILLKNTKSALPLSVKNLKRTLSFSCPSLLLIRGGRRRDFGLGRRTQS
jgi:beta-glucosidase